MYEVYATKAYSHVFLSFHICNKHCKMMMMMMMMMTTTTTTKKKKLI